jgi:glycerol-3-phosphate acyltransferase PlsY
MVFLIMIAALLLGYICGSVPIGLVIIRLTTGKDIRNYGSGRTGGTNAMRAGGMWAGIATGILDVLKSFFAVLLCRWVFHGISPMSFPSGNYLLEVLTGFGAVVGHNYSLFLIEWVDSKGGRKPVFHGGAGAAPTLGAATAFWFPSLLIILPIGLLVFIFVGYASITTLVGGLLVICIFAVRAYLGYSSAWYIVFGLAIMAILLWALRPNIDRLFKGTERLVGLRAWIKRKKSSSQTEIQTTQKS